MNGDMVREYPPYDFQIIFNATLCEILLTFDRQTKLMEMRKDSARWVPCTLIEDNHRNRMVAGIKDADTV